jgi:hypothetical protein
MSTPITIHIPHQLGRAEARRRIETGLARFMDLVPAGSGRGDEQWEGDRLRFRVAAMGQTVSGVVDVVDDAVALQIELPGALGLLAHGIRERLKKNVQLLLTKK